MLMRGRLLSSILRILVGLVLIRIRVVVVVVVRGRPGLALRTWLGMDM